MNDAAASYCIGWWNVRASEALATTEAHVSYVAAAIHEMKERHALDVLFLGEVTDTFINELRPLVKRDGFRMVRSGGKVDFGLAAAYNAETLSLNSSSLKSVIHKYGKDTRKIAQRVDIKLQGGDSIRFYFLHWPSRVYNPADTGLRSEMAGYLQNAIARYRAATTDKLVVVLGDFNDEPNDMPMRKLLTTRHVHMAQKEDFLFYNPFWRFLTDPVPYTREGRDARPPGTYYYTGGKTHYWHILDQMLFSSTFFGGSSWHLAEERTMIFELPGICEIGPKTRTSIDHLPILAAIERAGE
ncbi:endonuclease/exonuclease/phosphatase family protein [Rhizobium sp. PRIMUS64]|uniref:endonuclease/exonuclease/phosphatase family protein n=1 Tax=Rhizobium sp. PRIMUS64 TaxID=2908925 RepID=UPI001FF206E3|nr:endonuclease/exonuclease/phosphatase family protein [Rhizobium sp. PRIMUS64]MCJ9691357.1 endonuclease/exonuclease/phosphatase family protein [Rhizobium sp. PRIMUS64]